MSSEPIVVFMKSYLGDAVMATPLLDVLFRERRQVVVVTSPAARLVLQSPHRPAEFVLLRRLSRVKELLGQAAELRARKAPIALLVNRSFRSALAARLAGIPRRVGHATEGRSLLLTDAVPYDEDRREDLCYLDLASAAGFGVEDAPPPSLYVDDAEREEGAARADGATVAVQPGARYVEKRIPLDVAAAVIDGLHARGERVVLLGGDDEVSAGAAAMDRAAAPVVDLIGKCSIRQSIGVLASLRAAVGSDTGLMHLAAGIGCPTVTVFGPNSPAKWGHHRPPHRVLAAPGGRMERITASEIIEAVSATLDSPRGSPAS